MDSKIICIVGDSGAGKTSLARHMEKVADIPTVVSYTTRPMRLGEEQGVEHKFVSESEMPNKNDMLAFTMFGGHCYWAELKDIPENGIISYVIDEQGLLDLTETYGEDFEVVTVLIKRSEQEIANSVDGGRIKRDKGRIRISEDSYDLVLENSGSLEQFLEEGTAAIQNLLNSGKSLKR